MLKTLKNFYNFENKLFLILWYVGTATFSMIIAAFLISIFSFNNSLSVSKIETLETSKINIAQGIFIVVFVAVIIPIIEEFIFRFWIGRDYNFITFVSFGLFLLLTGSLFFDIPWFLIFFILFNLLFLLLNKRQVLLSNFNFKDKSNLLYYSIISSLIFGAGHFYYFKEVMVNDQKLVNLSIALTLFIFTLLGGILSFVKLRFGIKYSIMLHISLNFFATAPAILVVLYGKYFNEPSPVLIILYLVIIIVLLFLLLSSFIIGNIMFFIKIKNHIVKNKSYKNFVQIFIFVIILFNSLNSNAIYLIKQREAVTSIGQDLPQINNLNLPKNRKIAIIDTPIFRDHLTLKNTINQVICGLTICDCEFLESCNHATSVAGLVSIIDPSVKLDIYSFISVNGISDLNQITFALERILNSNIKYYSISLSSNTEDFFNGNCDDFNQNIYILTKKIKDRGTKIYVPTGNNGNKDNRAFPSCLTTVIPVASINSNQVDSEFSNFNNNNIKEVGEGIMAPIFDSIDKNKFIEIKGTSFANAIALAKNR